MRKLAKDEFITKAIAAHGQKYDYSRVVYNGSRQKVYNMPQSWGVLAAPQPGTNN